MVLVSTVQWSEVKFPVLYRFSLVMYFIYISVYMSIPISQFIPHPLSPLGSIHLFSMSLSVFLPCKQVHLYHLSRSHIYALIYDIYISLSDLLHSVWLSLSPSMSLQMIQFRSFLWLLFHCIYYMYHTFIHLSVSGYLVCFHDLAMVNNATMNIEVHVSFWIMVFSEYMPSSGVAGSYGNSIFSLFVFFFF